MNKNLYILFFLLFALHSGIAQAEKYRKKLKDYSEKLVRITVPSDEKSVHHFSYTEKVKSWDQASSQAPVKNNVSIYVKNDKFYFYSSQVDLFRDKEDSFIIIHKDKKIFHTNSVSQEETAKKQMESFLKFQNVVFEKGKILEYQELIIKGKKMARLMIATPEEIRKELKVRHTVYWYDIQGEKIWKSKIYYSKDYSLKTKEIIYQEVDLDYGAKLKKPVFKKVLDKKGNLTEEYRNYQLIDNK